MFTKTVISWAFIAFSSPSNGSGVISFLNLLFLLHHSFKRGTEGARFLLLHQNTLIVKGSQEVISLPLLFPIFCFDNSLIEFTLLPFNLGRF